MRKVVKATMLVLAAVLGYLLLWPVPITPVAWVPARFAGYTGPHARNDRLAKLRLVPIAPHVGPEHIAFGPDGLLYTGVLSGAVLRMQPDGTGVETYVNTEGRPLGLAFDAQGRLWNVEMGPQGGDELNLVRRGANYGYPLVSNGSHYGGADIPDHDTRPTSLRPRFSGTPSSRRRAFCS